MEIKGIKNCLNLAYKMLWFLLESILIVTIVQNTFKQTTISKTVPTNA